MNSDLSNSTRTIVPDLKFYANQDRSCMKDFPLSGVYLVSDLSAFDRCFERVAAFGVSLERFAAFVVFLVVPGISL